MSDLQIPAWQMAIHIFFLIESSIGLICGVLMRLPFLGVKFRNYCHNAGAICYGIMMFIGLPVELALRCGCK